MEEVMNQRIAMALAMLASAAFGALAADELKAQNKAPGAYAVIDISEITDSDVFTKQLLPKATPPVTAFGGQFVVRTENIAAINGTPPKRFVVIAFDSMEKLRLGIILRPRRRSTRCERSRPNRAHSSRMAWSISRSRDAFIGPDQSA
jgi:uncharacterized protein (DUF1330 family)